MPLYEFKCGSCGVQQDEFRSVNEASMPLTCNCGGTMNRLFTPSVIRSPLTGKDKAYKVLNREDGADLPARPYDRPRMEQAMLRGLNQTPQIQGVGF
jgi:putative FmdB family regulatory protein